MAQAVPAPQYPPAAALHVGVRAAELQPPIAQSILGVGKGLQETAPDMAAQPGAAGALPLIFKTRGGLFLPCFLPPFANTTALARAWCWGPDPAPPKGWSLSLRTPTLPTEQVQGRG